MNADEVTRSQTRIIRDKIVPMRAYLFALKKRMAGRGFAGGDPMFDLVANAAQAVGELYVDVRMRSGPRSSPDRKETVWLDRRSVRKRHDRR